MRVLKWYAPTDQQEITDIALHYVFEAEPGAKVPPPLRRPGLYTIPLWKGCTCVQPASRRIP